MAGLCTSFNRVVIVVINVVCMCLLSGLLQAEVYKYKDKAGNWQFSDKPPVNGKKVESLVLDVRPHSVVPADLKTALFEKFKPASMVEQATLSVVKVETSLGTGSGFFITEDGYLITNRHVVRPPADTTKKTEKEFNANRKRLNHNRSVLASRRENLKEEKINLQEYKEYLASLNDSEKTKELRKYQRKKRAYQEYKKETGHLARKIKQDAQKFADHRSNYQRRHANAMIAQQFKVQLKNDARLDANLVAVSEKQDLALLKIDDYQLPALELDKSGGLRQTDQVYAIGSPLGRKDYITSGIVTSFRKEKIIIDVTIQPGSSGGPLINEDGKVVGVNTWKMVAGGSILGDGFGIAIPIEMIGKEFSKYIKTNRDSAISDSNTDNVVEDGRNNDLLKSIRDAYEKSRSD